MKLFQFSYSPYAAKVRACLALKKLDCEIVEVPMMDRRELIAVTGGSIMVPVLLDGDAVISDSPRITAHLERYAPSLRPPPLGAVAVVFESWADNVLEDVAFRLASPAIEERIAGCNDGRADARALFRVIKERKFGAGCLETWRAQRSEFSARLLALLAPLDEALAAQPFLLSDAPTLADAAVYGQLHMLEWALPEFAGSLSPSLREWYRRLDAVAAPLAPTRRRTAMIALDPAGESDRPTIENLMQLYAYDFSELGHPVIGDDGRFARYPLDPYWREDGRHPLLLRSDGALAGFVLISARSRLTGADGVFDVAEFFVLRAHRRKGVGLAAACAAFDRFKGRWEVRQRRANVAATAFWRRAIGHHTGGKFDERDWDDATWSGPVQTFSSDQ